MKLPWLKRFLNASLAAVLIFSLAACSQNQEEMENEEPVSTAGEIAQDDPSNSAASEGQNILISYFSLPMEDGVDTVARASRKESDDGTFGNVRFMANVIQENVGGDLFAIETAQEYPLDNMDDLLAFAYDEKAENARPELSTILKIWMITMWSLSAIQTGTQIFPCRCIASLKNTIFLERL